MPATSAATSFSPAACYLLNSALDVAANSFGEQLLFTLSASQKMTPELPCATLIATHSLGSTQPIEFKLERVASNGVIRIFNERQPKDLLDAVKITLDRALTSYGLPISIGVD